MHGRRPTHQQPRHRAAHPVYMAVMRKAARKPLHRPNPSSYMSARCLSARPGYKSINDKIHKLSSSAVGFAYTYLIKCDPLYINHAVQRCGLRCHKDFSNFSAVRLVYRYVIKLKARFQMNSPKLPKSAPQQWQKIDGQF